MRLYGKKQVLERLQANPKSIKKIYFKTGKGDAKVLNLAQKTKVACFYLDNSQFAKISGHYNSQGVIAEVNEFVYVELETILALPDHKKYTLIALSNITDPQNLGSVLRTLACFGEFAIVLPRHRSVKISETVLKVACGGENYVPVIQVGNLIAMLNRIKQAGYWVTGSVVSSGEDITEFTFPFPLCLVIGAEDKGIRRGLIPHLDFKLTLPMPGEELSLNAAVATAIFCYEISKQRKKFKADKFQEEKSVHFQRKNME